MLAGVSCICENTAWELFQTWGNGSSGNTELAWVSARVSLRDLIPVFFLCVYFVPYIVFVLLNRKVMERFQQANRIPTWVYLGSDFMCQVPLCLGSCISITTNSSAPCLTAKVCVCPCELGCLFIQLMRSETFLPPRKGEDAKGSLWGRSLRCHWMKLWECHWLSLRWKSV